MNQSSLPENCLKGKSEECKWNTSDWTAWPMKESKVSYAIKWGITITGREIIPIKGEGEAENVKY